MGASALLTGAIAGAPRTDQGAADLVMGLTGMSGNLVAGPLFHAGAFGVLAQAQPPSAPSSSASLRARTPVAAAG